MIQLQSLLLHLVQSRNLTLKNQKVQMKKMEHSMPLSLKAVKFDWWIVRVWLMRPWWTHTLCFPPNHDNSHVVPTQRKCKAIILANVCTMCRFHPLWHTNSSSMQCQRLSWNPSRTNMLSWHLCALTSWRPIFHLVASISSPFFFGFLYLDLSNALDSNRALPIIIMDFL